MPTGLPVGAGHLLVDAAGGILSDGMTAEIDIPAGALSASTDLSTIASGVLNSTSVVGALVAAAITRAVQIGAVDGSDQFVPVSFAGAGATRQLRYELDPNDSTRTS